MQGITVMNSSFIHQVDFVHFADRALPAREHFYTVTHLGAGDAVVEIALRRLYQIASVFYCSKAPKHEFPGVTV